MMTSDRALTRQRLPINYCIRQCTALALQRAPK